MAGEPISSEAAAGWSRRNVADAAIVLIGFGLVVGTVGGLMDAALKILHNLQIAAIFRQRHSVTPNDFIPGLWTYFEYPLIELFLGLWLIARHGKISGRLFRAGPGASMAERRAGLAFGIKVYAVYLAAFAAIKVAGLASAMVTMPLMIYVMVARMIAGKADPGPPWILILLLTWLAPLVEMTVCLYFTKRPGWLVSLMYPEGEPDEDA